MTNLAFPLLIGTLVDGTNSSTSTMELIREAESGKLDGLLKNIDTVAILLFIIFLLQAVFSYFRVYLFGYVTERMLAKLRQDTYQNLIIQPMKFFSQRRVGELNSRISADITILQETFTVTLAEFLRQVLIIIGGIYFLIIYSTNLTLIMLGTLPVVVIIGIFFGRFIKKLSKRTQEAVAETNVIVEETLSGILNVKAFVNEMFEFNRYRNRTEEVRQIAMKGIAWRAGFTSFIIFSIFGAIAVVIWYGAHLKDQGIISNGDLITFMLVTVFVGASIGGIADQLAKLQKAVGATENLMDLLDEDGERLAEAKSELIKGDLVFDKVSFNYPSRPDIQVIKSVSFTAKQGEQVAIAGPSGSGKSTLISLLLRFYDPQSGVISSAGKNIQHYGLSDWRNTMALVPQEVLLFGGSIRENIAYGNPEASQEEIERAAEMANAKEFIEKFPEGYDTLVGERGIQLSGGQRQRIAIARAVLKDPEILLLDEATSSLDSESEHLVQEALNRVMKGRTSIVIAHRLSTIRKADKILVLEDGQIREEGNHEELNAIENGLYRKISSMQMDTQTS